MRIVDLHEPDRVGRRADGVEVLLSGGDFVQNGFRISRVELRLYKEGTDDRLGTFSLITSFVDTDCGSVETIYDEGFRGDDALRRAAQFLTSNLGISALILRSVITLQERLG